MARPRTLFFLIAAAGVAAILGYRKGFAASNQSVTPQASLSAATRPIRPIRPDLVRTDEKESLPLLLKRPANSRTRGELWSIVRGYSSGEIQQALEEIAPVPESEMSQWHRAMLYQRWGQIDAFAAMESAEAIPDEVDRRMAMSSTLTAWMKQDSEAAFRWAEKLPEFQRQEPSRMMANLLSSLTPAKALEQARSYGAEVHKSTLMKLASDLSTTPEDRAAFLAELARSGGSDEEKSASLAMFAETWGSGDPLAALGAMDELALDGGKKQQVRDKITRDWADKDATAALAWLVAKENAQPLKSQVDAYTRWAAREPESALSHLDQLEQQSPPLREGVMNALVVSSIRGGWTPWSGANPPNNLEMTKLKSHYTHWSELAPERAAAWLGNQDSKLQKQITTPEENEAN
ncbi:MAG: hypothetical protein V4640_08920 [Verrucomicrobiota bacterium]